MKPRIDRTNLKAIMIKVSRSYKFEVDVRGEPPPEVTWVLKEVKVTSDENIIVTNKNYYTELSIKKALRKHSGKYVITATNSSGKDVAEVDVTILGSYDVFALCWHTYIKALFLVLIGFSFFPFNYRKAIKTRRTFGS